MVDGDQNSTPLSALNDPLKFKKYLVYVDTKRCTHSRDLVTLLGPVEHDMLVEEVAELEDYPPWLNGTPILVDIKESSAYKGREAFGFANKIVSDAVPRTAEKSFDAVWNADGEVTKVSGDSYADVLETNRGEAMKNDDLQRLIDEQMALRRQQTKQS
jgi:hypothetical protein